MINENMIRSFIATEERREVVEDRDEITVLAIAANTYAQLNKQAEAGEVSWFFKSRLMTTVDLIASIFISDRIPLLASELMSLYKKTVASLGLLSHPALHLPCIQGEELMVMLDENMVNKLFTEDEKRQITIEFELACLYNRMGKAAQEVDYLGEIKNPVSSDKEDR